MIAHQTKIAKHMYFSVVLFFSMPSALCIVVAWKKLHGVIKTDKFTDRIIYIGPKPHPYSKPNDVAVCNLHS